MKKKPLSGIIENWQVHKLSISKRTLHKVYPNSGAQPMVVTGTVVKDFLGRWNPGHHMKTSLVVKIDRQKGELETLNARYKLKGKEGKDILPDLGDNVMKLFY